MAAYVCIKKFFHRQTESRERTPGLAETGVALTTLNEGGHPRTIQFRVDSWEAERQKVQGVMDEVKKLRQNVKDLQRRMDGTGPPTQDLQRRMNEPGPPTQDLPGEEYGGHQLRARPLRRN